MGLQNATILDGATLSATGGTSKTLTIDGQQVTNGIHLADASVADYRTRPNVTAKVKQYTLNSDGLYGKGKRSLTLTMPKILSSGKQGFPCIRIEMEDFPEMSDTEQNKLLVWAGQILFDADFTAFWKTGSLA